MKMLQSIALLMLMVTGIAANAVDQDVQVDILMSKIINAQKEGRAADALPSMAKLESMEPTLKTPLPESFHFLYITALDETGDHANALRRANLYVEKFGKRGKNYSKVVDIIGRLEDVVARENKEADARAEAERSRLKDEQEGRSPYCKELGRQLTALLEEKERIHIEYPVSVYCEDIPRSVKTRWGIHDDGRMGCVWDYKVATWNKEFDSMQKKYINSKCKTSNDWRINEM